MRGLPKRVDPKPHSLRPLLKILDRYILRLYLVNFAVLLVVLFGMFMVIDLIVNVDEFLEAADIYAQQMQIREAAQTYDLPSAQVDIAVRDRWSAETMTAQLDLSPGETEQLQRSLEPGWFNFLYALGYKIVDYYGPLLLLLYVFLSGVVTLGALGFTFTAMVRARELTAIVSSGVSMYRIAAPVLVTGIALNALALPIQELLIPPLAPRLARGPSDVSQESVDSFPVYLAKDMTHNVLLSAADFDAGAQQLRGIAILERNDAGGAVRRITAQRALWDESRGGWDLVDEGGYAISLTQDDLAGPDAGDPQHLTFYRTELSPTVILARQAAIYLRLLPIFKLQEMQNNEAIDRVQRNRVTQIIWARFTMLIVNALVLVMALRFFLPRSPSDVLWQSIKACALCLGAWGGSLVALQMPSLWLNPMAAAWLPVVLLLPVATWHLIRLET